MRWIPWRCQRPLPATAGELITSHTMAPLDFMRVTHILGLTCIGALVSGCAKLPQGATPVIATAEYAAREPIATSLFPSDQALMSDEAVGRILSSKLELPAKAKVVVMKFPDTEGSRYHWRDEEYLKLQQSQVDTLT